MLKKDREKITTLIFMHRELTDLLRAEKNYICYLFKTFQKDKYLKTNFFKDGTLENDILNFLDKYDMHFSDYLLPFYKIYGELDNFRNKICELDKQEYYENKRKQKKD